MPFGNGRFKKSYANYKMVIFCVNKLFMRVIKWLRGYVILNRRKYIVLNTWIPKKVGLNEHL